MRPFRLLASLLLASLAVSGSAQTPPGRPDTALAFGPESATPDGRQKLGETFSPVRFVSARMAPTLIIHGDADPLVPIQQAQLFVQRATAAGATARLIVKPGAAHGGKTWANVEGDRALMADWFDRHLRGLQPTTP